MGGGVAPVLESGPLATSLRLGKPQESSADTAPLLPVYGENRASP